MIYLSYFQALLRRKVKLYDVEQSLLMDYEVFGNVSQAYISSQFKL